MENKRRMDQNTMVYDDYFPQNGKYLLTVTIFGVNPPVISTCDFQISSKTMFIEKLIV